MATGSQDTVRRARRRLGIGALAVAALAAALVASQLAGGPDRTDQADAQYRLVSRAQAERCLTARGLHVAPAGARTLRVTGSAQLGGMLTFHATAEQAQAIASRWQATAYGRQRTLQRIALDNVTVRATSPLDDAKVRLLGSCIGWQPVRAST